MPSCWPPELTGLTSLRLAHPEYTGEGLDALSQLTGLQELSVRFAWLDC